MNKLKNVGNRKYEMKQDYFESIDTETKAYFLGYLYADGCNHANKNVISLELKNCDAHILEKLSRDIYITTKPLMIRKATTRLTLNSKLICKQLVELGMIQAKTFTLKFPTMIPENLIRHFIRGYIDGDGCIYSSKYQSNLELISTESFCKSISDIIQNKFKIIPNISIKKDNGINQIYRLRYFKRKCIIEILEWLYKDATIYLDRKYQKFQEMVILDNSPKKINQYC